MSRIIECFDEACEKYKERTAFIELKGAESRSISFEKLAKDVDRVRLNLIEEGMKPMKSIMLFVSPSYELLVFMMACLKIGASLMIIDIWAGRELIKKTFEEYQADYIAVSGKTDLLRLALPEIRRIKKKIYMEDIYSKHPLVTQEEREIPERELAVLTMTSGSTGRPKIILRSHRDLFHQFDLVRRNMEEHRGERLVLNTSFMYHFVNILNGYTAVLFSVKRQKVFDFFRKKRVKSIENIPIQVLYTTPDFCLDTELLFPKLEELYFGGAILNLYEAEKIRAKFPNVKITYIYGATECNLITKTNLDTYIKGLKQGKTELGRAVEGVKIKVDERGEIMVQAAVVLSDYLNPENQRGFVDETGMYWHRTGDAAYLDNGSLYYLGRRDVFVRTRKGDRYSNTIEQDIVRTFPGVKKCACFYHKGMNYLFTEGDFSDEERLIKFARSKGIEHCYVKCGMKIAVDAKHQSKIHYNELKKLTESWNGQRGRKYDK